MNQAVFSNNTESITAITDAYVLRFLSKLVETPTGCLEYQNACSPNGYGQFWNGEKSISAHRYSYQTFVDDLPADGVIMHSCSNKRCCAWWHLSAGTHKENSQAAKKDGLLNVVRKPYRKATQTEIDEIRQKHAQGTSKYALALAYGRSQPYIAAVVSGKLHPIDRPIKPKRIIRRKPTPTSVPDVAVMQEAA